MEYTLEQSIQDNERRFGGVARLYGSTFSEKLQLCHIVVVGLGGVGSWVVEALSRFGVQQLSLIDLDHVSISNTNRQLQALEGCFGASKVKTSSIRARLINPSIQINEIEDWIDEHNINSILSTLTSSPIDAILDCTDQVNAKAALVFYAQTHRIPLIVSGAAGGKLSPQQLQIAPLLKTTHDPLLAKVRACLRKKYAETGLNMDRGHSSSFVKAVFSTEPVKYPQPENTEKTSCHTTPDRQGLNCGGFGSSLLVTGSMAFLMVYALLDEWQKE